MKSGFKRTINWNKYQSKISSERQNLYLDFLIDPSFQGVYILFVLLFENEEDRKVRTKYNLPKVEIKNYNVMIDGKNFFDQSVKSVCIRTFDNIRETETGKDDGYTSGCLLDYNYFNKHYKMIAINLSKQQALDADSKVIKQINFIGNLERDNGTTILFIIEEAKKNNSFKRNFESIVKSIVNLFYFNTISILNTQCRALNVKFSDSQLNKIKS